MVGFGGSTEEKTFPGMEVFQSHQGETLPLYLPWLRVKVKAFRSLSGLFP